MVTLVETTEEIQLDHAGAESVLEHLEALDRAGAAPVQVKAATGKDQHLADAADTPAVEVESPSVP
jgi:hypothetical protein